MQGIVNARLSTYLLLPVRLSSGLLCGRRRHRRRPLELDQPVVVSPVRVARDVVEDDEQLELLEEVDAGLLGQRLRLEATQHLVRVLVALHEGLEGAHLSKIMTYVMLEKSSFSSV